MKLRYYLRGLGIGMLVAALVLILSGNTGGRMSDEAVKRRAVELGMVEKNKTVLEDVAGGGTSGKDAEQDTEEAAEPRIKESGTVSENTADVQSAEADAEPKEDAERKPQAGGEDENTADGQEEKEVQPQQSEEQKAVEEIEKRAEEIAERGHEVAENSVPETIVTFVVQHGDSSISVARRAQELGLVVSAADFDVFLCQNGYDKRISVGSYEIAVGESEKEIADKITRSR